MSDEAFVYLWFDAKSRMFYLGKHLGHPDDKYTHSSQVMESFTKNNIPSYMRRRILATGTEVEMIALENRLQENRVDRGKWDKYYNVKIGAHFPIDINIKHGSLRGARSDPTVQRDYLREKRQDPVYKENEKEKTKLRARKRRAENLDKVREYDRNYRQKNKDRLNKRRRELRHAKENGFVGTSTLEDFLNEA